MKTSDSLLEQRQRTIVEKMGNFTSEDGDVDPRLRDLMVTGGDWQEASRAMNDLIKEGLVTKNNSKAVDEFSLTDEGWTLYRLLTGQTQDTDEIATLSSGDGETYVIVV